MQALERRARSIASVHQRLEIEPVEKQMAKLKMRMVVVDDSCEGADDRVSYSTLKDKINLAAFAGPQCDPPIASIRDRQRLWEM